MYVSFQSLFDFADASASITTSIITSSITRTHNGRMPTSIIDGWMGWRDVDALIDCTPPDTLDLTHPPPTPEKRNVAKRRK